MDEPGLSNERKSSMKSQNLQMVEVKTEYTSKEVDTQRFGL